MDWKPFSTAPTKTEGSFLVYLPEAPGKHEVCHVYKISNGFMIIIGGHFLGSSYEPSHWTKLVAPNDPTN